MTSFKYSNNSACLMLFGMRHMYKFRSNIFSSYQVSLHRRMEFVKETPLNLQWIRVPGPFNPMARTCEVKQQQHMKAYLCCRSGRVHWTFRRSQYQSGTDIEPSFQQQVVEIEVRSWQSDLRDAQITRMASDFVYTTTKNSRLVIWKAPRLSSIKVV